MHVRLLLPCGCFDVLCDRVYVLCKWVSICGRAVGSPSRPVHGPVLPTPKPTHPMPAPAHTHPSPSKSTGHAGTHLAVDALVGDGDGVLAVIELDLVGRVDQLHRGRVAQGQVGPEEEERRETHGCGLLTCCLRRSGDCCLLCGWVRLCVCVSVCWGLEGFKVVSKAGQGCAVGLLPQ